MPQNICTKGDFLSSAYTYIHIPTSTGRTPKAILERTAKLRREAKSCSATTNPTSTPAAGLTKSSKQPLSKKGTNTNAHFAKYNNQNNNEEEKEEGKSRDLKVKSPHRPRSGGGGEVEGGRKRKVPPLATTATKQEQEQESENEIVKETGKRIKLEQELDNEGIGE